MACFILGFVHCRCILFNVFSVFNIQWFLSLRRRSYNLQYTQYVHGYILAVLWCIAVLCIASPIQGKHPVFIFTHFQAMLRCALNGKRILREATLSSTSLHRLSYAFRHFRDEDYVPACLLPDSMSAPFEILPLDSKCKEASQTSCFTSFIPTSNTKKAKRGGQQTRSECCNFTRYIRWARSSKCLHLNNEQQRL